MSKCKNLIVRARLTLRITSARVLTSRSAVGSFTAIVFLYSMQLFAVDANLRKLGTMEAATIPTALVDTEISASSDSSALPWVRHLSSCEDLEA